MFYITIDRLRQRTSQHNYGVEMPAIGIEEQYSSFSSFNFVCVLEWRRNVFSSSRRVSVCVIVMGHSVVGLWVLKSGGWLYLSVRLGLVRHWLTGKMERNTHRVRPKMDVRECVREGCVQGNGSSWLGNKNTVETFATVTRRPRMCLTTARWNSKLSGVCVSIKELLV
jgi:hypothetical protein